MQLDVVIMETELSVLLMTLVNEQIYYRTMESYFKFAVFNKKWTALVVGDIMFEPYKTLVSWKYN